MMKEETNIALQKLEDAEMLTPDIQALITAEHVSDPVKLATALIELNDANPLTQELCDASERDTASSEWDTVSSERATALIKLNNANLLIPENLKLVYYTFDNYLRPDDMADALIKLNNANLLTPAIREFIYQLYKCGGWPLALNGTSDLADALIKLNNPYIITTCARDTVLQKAIALIELNNAGRLDAENWDLIRQAPFNADKLAIALIRLADANMLNLLFHFSTMYFSPIWNLIREHSADADKLAEALIAMKTAGLLYDNSSLLPKIFDLTDSILKLNEANIFNQKIWNCINSYGERCALISGSRVPLAIWRMYASKMADALIKLNNANLLTPENLQFIYDSYVVGFGFNVVDFPPDELVNALIKLNNPHLLTTVTYMWDTIPRLAITLIKLNDAGILNSENWDLIKQDPVNAEKLAIALIKLNNAGMFNAENWELIKQNPSNADDLADALIELNNAGMLNSENRALIKQNPNDFDTGLAHNLIALQKRGIHLKRVSKNIITNVRNIQFIIQPNINFYKDIFTFIFTTRKIHDLIAAEEIQEFLQSLEGVIVEDSFRHEGPAIRTIKDIWCCLISHLLPDIKDDFMEFIYSAKDIFLQLIAVAPEEMREFIVPDRLAAILPDFEVRELYNLVQAYPDCRKILNPEQAEQLKAFEEGRLKKQMEKSGQVIQRHRRNMWHAIHTNSALFKTGKVDTRKNRPYGRGLGGLIAPVVGVSEVFPVVTHYGQGDSNFTGVLKDSALRSKTCLRDTIHKPGISAGNVDKHDAKLVSFVPFGAKTVKSLQDDHLWEISINLNRLPPELGTKVYFKIYDFYYLQADFLKYARENLNFELILIRGKIKLEISGNMQGIKYTFVDLTTNETCTVTVNPSQTVYHGLRGLGNFIVGYLLQIIDQLANVPEGQNLHHHITQYLEGLNAAERKACVIDWARRICNLSEFDFIWQIELDLDFVDAIQYGGQEIKMKDIVDAVATGNIDYLNNVFTSVPQLQAAEFFITGIFKLAVQHQQPAVIAWLQAQPFAQKPTIREKMEQIAAADEAQVMDDIKILVKSLYRSPNFQITKEGNVVTISAKCVRGKRGDGVFHMDLCAVQRALGNKFYMQKDPYNMGSEALEEVRIVLDGQPHGLNTTQGYQAFDSLRAFRDALLTGVLENMFACRQNSRHYQSCGEHHPHTGKGGRWWRYVHRLGDVSIQARVLPNQDIEVKFAQLPKPEFPGSSLLDYRRYLIEYLKQPEEKIFFSPKSPDTLIIEGGARLISRAIANQQANNFGIIILDERGNPLLAERFDYETGTSLGLAAAGGNNRNSFAPELLTEAKEFGFKPLPEAITDERIEIIHVDGDKALAIMPYGTYEEDKSATRLSVQATPFRIDIAEFTEGSQTILPFHEMRGKNMRNTRCWELYFAHMEYQLNRLLGTTGFSNLVVKIGSKMPQQDGFLIPDDDFGKIFIESPYPEIPAENLSQMQQILQTHLPKAKIELDGNRIAVDYVSPQMFLQVLDQQLAPNPRYKTPHTCSQRGGPVVALSVMQAGLWRPSCKNVPAANAASQERAQPEVSA